MLGNISRHVSNFRNSFEGRFEKEAKEISITVQLVDCRRRNPVIYYTLRTGILLPSGGLRAQISVFATLVDFRKQLLFKMSNLFR